MSGLIDMFMLPFTTALATLVLAVLLHTAAQAPGVGRPGLHLLVRVPLPAVQGGSRTVVHRQQQHRADVTIKQGLQLTPHLTLFLYITASLLLTYGRPPS